MLRQDFSLRIIGLFCLFITLIHPIYIKKSLGRKDIRGAVNVYFMISSFNLSKNFLHETLVIKYVRNAYK